MNFYQSDLRRTINQHIYKKPIFEHTILWKKYFGITKTQKRFGKSFSWYMIHGIEGVDFEDTSAINEMLAHIKRDFGSRSGDIFFQFWFLDVLKTDVTAALKSDDALVVQYNDERDVLEKKMLDEYKLLPSWREHMPDTTNIIDISQWIQETRKWYSKSCKRYINKAKKENLEFEIAEKKDWKKFREIWYTMAYDKGFSILPWETFEQLMIYLTDEDHGRLMVAKKGSKIVSGSVVLKNIVNQSTTAEAGQVSQSVNETMRQWDNEAVTTWEKGLIYLYGATNREYGNIGGHYWLTDEIMKRWAHHDYMTYDLLWVAPVGNDKHYLSWVTRFKQSFGGKTITSIGNFDMVFNAKGYRIMQFLKRMK